MRRLKLSSYLGLLVLLFYFTTANAQYDFPTCYPAFDPAHGAYTGGDMVSHNGMNYQCAYYVTTAPPSPGWTTVGPCGDGGLGPDYEGPQRIIGYLPYWVPDYDLVNDFDPSVVTHLNIAFNLFKQNNNNYNSADFASIEWADFHKRKVDSVLFDLNVLNRAHQAGVTVSVAVGGATDFAFIWLMEHYYQNDAKLEEIANLIVNYVNTTGIDGVDLDMECWWPDPEISGTVEKGGRVRGDKWGGTDQGPEPAAIGLAKLAEKLRQKMPNKLLSAAVFGTSWYGNNYDDAIAEHLDWLGLMTYDFTGSWDKSPKGPHSALYKVPQAYPGQDANNPIYSAQDALEYWMGLAEPAWNHDGGFNVPKAKLAIGVPLYGYDFSQEKPNNGNGYVAVPYRTIVEQYPNAATSYDPQDSYNLGGKVDQIYYNTPNAGAAKIKYTKDYGHQGIIIWELTQDVPYNSNSSILKAINDEAGNNIGTPPVVSITSPADNATYSEGQAIVITATATDADGTVTKVDFYVNNNLVGTATSGPDYSFTWNGVTPGQHELKTVATDNDGKTGTSALVHINVNYTPVLTSIGVTPATASILVNTTQQFAAQAYDQTGAPMNASITWSATGGSISASGLYTAGNVSGNFIVTATSGTVNGTASVEVQEEQVPVLTSIVISPSTADILVNTTQQFSAQGYDQNNNAMDATYNWTATGGTVSSAGLYTAGDVAGDFVVTASSGTISGAASVTISGGGACDAPAYVENGGYSGGDQVENNGVRYECKPFPYEGWCNGQAWAYAPGEGMYWTDAWIEVGPCSSALKSGQQVQSPTFSTSKEEASIFPNPFNDFTNIKFRLAKDAHVEIKVYNSAGNEIATLLNEQMCSGYHKIRFDGSSLTPGLYIYTIRQDNDVVTGNLIKK